MDELLQQLRNAVERADWILAADVCLELSLAARSSLEPERVDELAKSVRLQDAERIAAIVSEMICRGGGA